MTNIALTPEQCEAYARGADIRANQHTADAVRSLNLADECRADAARWRARAESLAPKAEPPVAPRPPLLGEATGDSASEAAPGETT
jgi:hypothetical protein